MRFVAVERLRELAETTPDNSAVSFGDQTLTFAALHRRSSQVANGLQGLGVAPGSRVCHVGRNRPEFFEIAFGCAMAGAVLAPLNWRLTQRDIHELVTDAQSMLVFVDPEFVLSIPAGVHTVVIGDNYDVWRDAQTTAEAPVSSGVDDEFIQFYTSGTTGLPKGVVIHNSNLGYLARAGEHWKIDSDSVVAMAMPLFHMGGSAWGLVSLFRGAHGIVVPDFDPEAVLDLIEQRRVTHILLAPTMLEQLVASSGSAHGDYSSLQAVLYGSAPISAPLLRAVIETFDVPLIQLFGLTETTGGIVQLDWHDHKKELLASIGKPYPWVELEIRDPSTTEKLTANQVGEIWVRSGQCAPGYWRRTTATAHLLTADGWLRTGDAGYIDADGYVFLTDRIKDVIITGGENVYPAEVERVLVEHPSVAEVAVIGVPDKAWGEVVTAVVVPREGEFVDANELIAWARPRLAGFRRPRRIEVIAALPRSPQGKVLRRELRAPYWEAADRLI